MTAKKTKTVYLVQISVGTAGDQTGYVKLIPRTVGGVYVNLVKKRDSATQFPSQAQAEVASDWVYQNYWRRGTAEEDYEDAWHLRQVVKLETRIPPPPPCPKCAPKKRGRPRELDDNRVRRFYEIAQSLSRTAKHFKVSRGAIQKSLARSAR